MMECTYTFIQEKKNTVEVTSLVGRVTRISDELEGHNFRAMMARLRYLERKRRRESIMNRDITSGDDLSRSVHLADEKMPFIPEKPIMASVTFPLSKFKKTILLDCMYTL